MNFESENCNRNDIDKFSGCIAVCMERIIGVKHSISSMVCCTQITVFNFASNDQVVKIKIQFTTIHAHEYWVLLACVFFFRYVIQAGLHVKTFIFQTSKLELKATTAAGCSIEFHFLQFDFVFFCIKWIVMKKQLHFAQNWMFFGAIFF